MNDVVCMKLCTHYIWILCAISTIFSVPSLAQKPSSPKSTSTFLASIEPRFSGGVRLRYQYTNQEEFDQNADALTLRFKGNAEVDLFSGATFLAEIETVSSIVENFNDGANGNVLLPFIPDPSGVRLNRLQIVSQNLPKTRITIGRQKIEIDDWRFIGNFPFRQNDQTFDAVRIETRAIGPGHLDVGYFSRVLRPLGGDNLQGVFQGDSWYANYNIPTSIGRFSLFHYALDLRTGDPQSGASGQPLDQSTQTSGVRLSGRRHWDNLGIIWEGAYAIQSDLKGNPNDFSAEYALGEISIEPGAFQFKFRVEILGDDNGIALQTPLASLHRFQGLSDQFLQTPPDGLRDYSVLISRKLRPIGLFKKTNLFAGFHYFEANTGGETYGTEFNAGLRARINQFALSLEFAAYDAETFSSDTQTLFFTTEFQF